MSEQVSTMKPSLLVFADDWGRHPSSCQHLMRRFLDTTPIWWVNTIGMRPPKFDRVTLMRGVGKIRQWVRPSHKPETGPTNPHVLNPRMWPWFTRRHDRFANRLLLQRQIAPVLEHSRSPVVAITTVPIVADLMGLLPVGKWVYYCVDDFSKWPELDQVGIQKMESDLIQRADVLIAASEALQRNIAKLGRPSHLLTHGVDLAHWRDGSPREAAAALEGLPRPLIMFYGSIDWQMDVEFVHRLSRDLSQGTIVLVGPTANPSPDLFRPANVRWIPAVPYADLPCLAHEASVLVMPYIDAPGLRESQPLKLKEYLASGKPAVVRDLPANRVWQDALDLAGSAEDFSSLVRQRLEHGLPDDQARARERLEQESWESKAERLRELIVQTPSAVNECHTATTGM